MCKVDDFHWDSAKEVVMPVSVFDTDGEGGIPHIKMLRIATE
ncbi:hypothetical protein [Microbulbifer sp. ALW1]|nr:hypothetical protein [Microbulbifer sp. ALW1]